MRLQSGIMHQGLNKNNSYYRTMVITTFFSDGYELSYFTKYCSHDIAPEHSQCLMMEMDFITSLFIVYRYDNTTGTFTVPPGGDGFY